MQIDLKVPGALTLNAVTLLFQSKDDSQHRQVRVSKNGIVYLSDDVGNSNLANVATCFETCDAGNDYVGANITASDSHVQFVYEKLLAWPNLPSYIDH